MIRAALSLILLSTAAAAQPVSGVAESCVACHGPRGAGSGSVPPLAGRDASELAAAMAAFRANERPATIMNRIARGYTEAETAAVAAYFAGLR
ncbi:c-type cytochrome [Roseomonas populi]|uniref:C-type cytochrome n=1 Tax=Roseomonas populi TaxID=3121582 RepID=A0ABT1X4R8_9PROT|nr:c-type cytochrome [Roseomonas pecuniae]MCR0982771.1 c-type cytochrome [Roseomonas pecuniae]